MKSWREKDMNQKKLKFFPMCVFRFSLKSQLILLFTLFLLLFMSSTILFGTTFTIIYGTFSKINGSQIDPKHPFGSKLKSQLILLFSLFLQLFMGLIAHFDTIYGSHCTISLFTLFLAKKFNFKKINESQTNLNHTD